MVTFVLFGYFLLCMVTVTDRTAQHGPDAVAEPYPDGDSYLREADTADPDPDATRRRRPRIVAAGRYRDTRRSTTCGPVNHSTRQGSSGRRCRTNPEWRPHGPAAPPQPSYSLARDTAIRSGSEDGREFTSSHDASGIQP